MTGPWKCENCGSNNTGPWIEAGSQRIEERRMLQTDEEIVIQTRERPDGTVEIRVSHTDSGHRAWYTLAETTL